MEQPCLCSVSTFFLLSLRSLLLNCMCSDEGHLTSLRMQHKNECKGLIVQIRYLKAKFTRESTLRSDLGFQKGYLLALLARSERT